MAKNRKKRRQYFNQETSTIGVAINSQNTSRLKSVIEKATAWRETLIGFYGSNQKMYSYIFWLALFLMFLLLVISLIAPLIVALQCFCIAFFFLHIMVMGRLKKTTTEDRTKDNIALWNLGQYQAIARLALPAGFVLFIFLEKQITPRGVLYLTISAAISYFLYGVTIAICLSSPKYFFRQAITVTGSTFFLLANFAFTASLFFLCYFYWSRGTSAISKFISILFAYQAIARILKLPLLLITILKEKINYRNYSRGCSNLNL